MKLNIGCAAKPMEGWINCDLTPGVADLVFDCQDEWPVPESSVQIVSAVHVIEHLERPMDFFRQAWRALMPNGQLHLQMPYGGNRLAMADPTHLRPWWPESLACLQPGFDQQNGNPQHNKWGCTFGIPLAQVRMSRYACLLMRQRKYRKLIPPLIQNLYDIGEEILVDLFAIKTEEAYERYLKDHPMATAVYIQWCAYKHDVEGRSIAELKPGEPLTLVDMVGTLSRDTLARDRWGQ